MRNKYHKHSLVLDIGKVPPQAIDIEEAVISAILIDSDAINLVAHLLKPEIFYKEDHCKIITSIINLHKSGRKIDSLTIVEQLKKDGYLEDVGGPYEVVKISRVAASSKHIVDHVAVLYSKYSRRELINAASRTVSNAYDDSIDDDEVISEANSMITSVTELYIGKEPVKRFSEIVDSSVDGVFRRAKNTKEGIKNGIPSCIQSVDNLFGGWSDGDLIIIAARPGMGKTALCIQFAINAAELGFWPAYFSLEVSSNIITDRMLINMTDDDSDEHYGRRFRTGHLTNDQLEKIKEKSNHLRMMPLIIKDDLYNITEIEAQAMLLSRHGMLDVLFIDYLQLMSGGEGKNRDEIVGSLSKSLKHLAKKLNVPVILISSLSREVERRGGRKIPQLSDLRESGNIEYDADVIMFPYRPYYYGFDSNEDGSSTIGQMDLFVAKNRNGEPGVIRMLHNKSMTRFYDCFSDVNTYKKNTPGEQLSIVDYTEMKNDLE